MTASLISTHTNDSYDGNHHPNYHQQRKAVNKSKRAANKSKLTINNLLFSRNVTVSNSGQSSSSPVVELEEIVTINNRSNGVVVAVGASSSSLAEDTASSTGSSPPSSYDNSPNRPNKQASKQQLDLDGGDHQVESVCLLDKQGAAPSVNNFSSFGRNAKLTSNYGPIAVRTTARNNTAIDESINVEDCSLGKREIHFFCL